MKLRAILEVQVGAVDIRVRVGQATRQVLAPYKALRVEQGQVAPVLVRVGVGDPQR